jgi:hypothetical protein
MGRTCCELDALNPNELRARVERAIVERIDIPAWHRMREIEAMECQSLRDILNTWRDSLSDDIAPDNVPGESHCSR